MSGLPTPSTAPLRGDVAIIGMSCLFPGAPDLDAYWHNIASKIDAMSDPPLDAWDAASFYDPASTSTDRVYCKRGGFLGPIARFNPLAHGIVPLAVEGGEPDQWLALQLAHDALADAGYADKPAERERTAVILGKGTYINRGNLSLIQHGLMVEQVLQILRPLHPEYSEADFEAIRRELQASLPPLNTDTASALIPNVIAGRIANRLDLMGPSYTVDGACASSLLAVEIAMRDLLTRNCDLALVGGAQVTTPIPILTLFCQLNALSHREELRAFDAAADGTVLGEGIGMIVLKRRADAERDGDRIYAVIKGVGSASDGRAVSVMAPRLEGEVLALRRAYEMAGVDPQTVELVEAHGTGTPVGDVVEVEALRAVFGGRDGLYPRTGIGTVKSMIGHTMPAAGIAGLIKAALALYHKTLPPTLHVDRPNPKLQLEESPFYVNTETRPWIHGSLDTPRRAGVNAFGFGGINAHVVLEEHLDPAAAPLRSHHLHWDSEACILAADSRDELLARIDRLRSIVAAEPIRALKDVAYTLNVAERAEAGQQWRLAIVAGSLMDLGDKLDRARHRITDPACAAIKDVRGIYFTAQPLAREGKVAFLFPGEGAQYVNMLSDLCMHFPEVRAAFDQIDRIYADHPRGYLPSDVIFPRPAFDKVERAEAAKRLWQMDAAIEAVLTANHALFTLLGLLHIVPDVIVGHSTGEYSALRASGAFDFSDEEVYKRFLRSLNRSYEAEIAHDGVPRAGLLAIGSDRIQVEALVSQVAGALHVAMDNCNHQTVVAGDSAALAQATELARSRGLIHEVLPFDRAYHTPLFERYAGHLREVYAAVPVRVPWVELYSCATMSAFPRDPAGVRSLALNQWVRTVEFSKTITTMYDGGVRIFVEVGPKGNLAAFVDDILGERPYVAVPANVARRSGIMGLNHMIALLAVHGVPMALDYLYRRRDPHRIGLEATPEASNHDLIRPLATGWPPLRLSPELTTHLRAMNGQAASNVTESPTPVQDVAGAAEAAVKGEPPAPSAAPVEPESAVVAAPTVPEDEIGVRSPGRQIAGAPLRAAMSPAAAEQVVHTYLHAMDHFIAVQEQLMQRYVIVARHKQAERQDVGRPAAPTSIEASATVDDESTAS